MDTTDKPRTHTCRFCGDQWQGSHSCVRTTKPTMTDPKRHFAPGGRNDAAVWGP